MPGTTTYSQQHAAHNRYHAARNQINPNCRFCLREHPELASMPASSKKARGTYPTDPALIISRCASMGERNCTAEEAAQALDMSVETFNAQFLEAFAITWDQYTKGAYSRLLDDVNATIWSRAKAGDSTFVKLLVLAGKLPGFRVGSLSDYQTPVTAYPEIPSPQLTNGLDLRSIPTADLQELRRKALEKVIDKPGRFDRIGPISSTLELVSGTEEDQRNFLRGEAPLPPRGSDQRQV